MKFQEWLRLRNDRTVEPWALGQLESFLLIMLLITATAWGETPWRLTQSDLSTQDIDVRKMDANGLDYVDSDGHMQHVAADHLVEIRRSAPLEISTGHYLLMLSDGQRWAGDATGMSSEQLAWQSSLLGQTMIPLPRIAGIIRQGGSFAQSANASEDIVNLANGDAVRGAVTAITDQKVTVQTSSAPAAIAWTAIASIHFASLNNSVPTIQPDENWQINLDDGSILNVAAVAWAGNSVELTVHGIKHSVDSSRVTAMEQLHGPVLFLASEAPVENVQVPLLGMPWQARMGRDLDGNVLPEAISVHAYSRLAWSIPAGFEKFHLRYMIPPDLSFADVTVRIQIDGKNVYEQSHLHGGTVSPGMDLPLNHGQRLVIEVDTSNPYRTQGWLTWISPALLR